MTTKERWLRTVTTMVVATSMLVVSACSTTKETQLATYVHKDDTCSSHRAQLINQQKDIVGDVAEGAAVGAIPGIAMIIGGAVLGSEELMVAGAGLTAAGAMAGGTVGYLRAKRQQAGQQQALLRAIDSDITHDIRSLNALSSALDRLNTCRARQIESVRQRVESGQITAATARQEAARLRQRAQQDNRLVQEILGEYADRQKVYVESIAQTRQINQAIVAREATRYNPTVRRRDGRVTASRPSRPETDDPVSTYIVERKDVEVEQLVQVAEIKQDLDDLDLFLSRPTL